MLACTAARGCLVRNADIPGDCEAVDFHRSTPPTSPPPTPPPQSCTLGRPSPERRRRIRVARLNPGIPELEETGEERGGVVGWGNTSFHFFPSRSKTAPSFECALSFSPAHGERSPIPTSLSQIAFIYENWNDVFHVHGLLWINHD